MSALARISAEWRGNPRLRWGFWLIVAVLSVESFLRWQDEVLKAKKELAALKSEVQSLQDRQKAETANIARLDGLKLYLQKKQRALNTVSTEALGQARLRDDIAELFEAQKLEAPVVSLQSATPLSTARAPGAAGEPTKQDPQLRMFRASVSFRFSPEALEQLLGAIEASESFVTVDALLVRAGDRRAELTLSQVMRVQSVLKS
jgi:Type II secretion system (T2SS), protein M subtype b